MMWMIIFLALPLLGVGYAAWHVWQVLPWATAWKCFVLAAGLLAFACIFLNFSGTLERLPLNVASRFYDFGNSFLIILLYLVIIFLLLDIGRLFHLIPKAWLIHNGTTSLVITLLMLAVFIYGNLHYHNKIRQPLQLSTAKQITKPLRMVMISDLHLGYHNRRAEFHKWIDMMNSEQPDLILIAGDIIDISVRPLIDENMAEEFRRLKAPVYACLGNHEYYSGEPRAQQFYRDAGIHLLRDTSVVVGDVCIIGRDDRTNPSRKSIAELARTADHSKYTIVLDHQPYHLDRTEKAGIDFQFSGHTHDGQVWPISWITHRIYECAFGSYQRGQTQYYVSSGIGIWGGKFRIGTRSEYVVATLSRE
jgi:predicted MPP superfamily phosphohydrolase